MQGYGQGGQPPGYPPGPPGAGNPPQGWQQPTQLAQQPAYGAPPGAPQQPFGAPGGFAPAAPDPYGQPPGMPQPGMAPPPAQGYGMPAQAPMGAPGSAYEFNDTENQTVNKLAGRLMTAGIMQIIFGVISLFGNFFMSLSSGLLGVPGSIAMIIIGALFASAAGSFKQISRTQGNDMGHLMQAMDKLSMASMVQIVGYIVAALFFIIGVILIGFLFAAMFAAAL